MSTTVNSARSASKRLFRVEPSVGNADAIYLEVEGVGIHVTRADFLAAVQAECHVRLVPADAIVIEPHTVAWVGKREPAESLVREIYPGKGVVQDWQIEAAKAYARMLLAAAEYLTAHPPVDEAQVQAVDAVIKSLGSRWERNDNDLARRLVEKGVRVEATR